MKIALVILHADPAKGGAERYTFDLAQALATRGHDVTLIAATFGPRPAGVECVALGNLGLTKLGRYRRFLTALDSHQDAHAYDVIHAMLPVRRCDLYHPHAGVAADAIQTGHRKHARWHKWLGAAVANRLNLKRRAFAAIERRLLTSQTPPIVLCLSDYVKATVRRHYPLSDDRLATLFNAVDLAKYDPAARPGVRAQTRQRLGIAENATIALIVAQDFERKGVREAIDALATQPEPRPTLLVVGKDDARPYEQAARRANVAGQVVFAGPTHDVYAAYAAADYFVLPTRHDPCSLVVLEALAMGLPVISTKQNGACEIMTQGVHGVILDDADDQPALTAAMSALTDPAIRHRMSAACLALRPKLAYETHVATLIAIDGRVRSSNR